MLDYSFVEILESLTREELKSFRRFILSPYFNRSPKVVRLFDIIARYHPNFESPKLTKEKLHQKISPELPYNEITMRRLLFDLQNLAEKYMMQVNFEKKNAESGIALIEELAKRGSLKMHSKSLKAEKKILDSAPYVDSDGCLNRFRLETEDFYHGMINNKINRKSFVNTEAGKLINGITYLISYFMIEAVKHNDVLLTYSRSYNVKNNINFIQQFIDLFDFNRLEIFMKSKDLKGRSTVEVYLNTLKAFFYFDNEQYYDEFKSSVYKNENMLSPDDKHHLFFKLTDYCRLKINGSQQFDVRFENELFSIYQTLLEKRYYETASSGYIPADLYRNILLQSARVKELAWMEDFIQEYSRKLHPNKMNDILSYSYAMLYFHRGAHERSLEFLSRIKDEEFVYRLDVRNLYFMNYFEMKQYDTAISLIKSYKKYLTENTAISEESRLFIGSFLKYAQKLINFYNSTTKTDLTALKLQIGKSAKVANKQWLLGKVEELSKSARRAV